MDPTLLRHLLNFVGYFGFVIVLFEVGLVIMTVRWLNSPGANVMKILFISLCLAIGVPVVFSTVSGYLLWRVGYFGEYGLVDEEASGE
jgi:hypothetical protein